MSAGPANAVELASTRAVLAQNRAPVVCFMGRPLCNSSTNTYLADFAIDAAIAGRGSLGVTSHDVLRETRQIRIQTSSPPTVRAERRLHMSRNVRILLLATLVACSASPRSEHKGGSASGPGVTLGEDPAAAA